MIRPRRFLVRIAVFLIAVLIVAGLLFQPLLAAFMANPALNGLILGVLLIGIGLNIRQVAMLGPEASWIDEFRQNQDRVSVTSGTAPAPAGSHGDHARAEPTAWRPVLTVSASHAFIAGRHCLAA